jgi:hypothetical protein
MRHRLFNQVIESLLYQSVRQARDQNTGPHSGNNRAQQHTASRRMPPDISP